MTISVLILPLAAFTQLENLAASAQNIPNNSTTTQSKKVVARIWHGIVPTSKADEYYGYLVESGI
ncbi:hypothetical protein [Calothrix sp. FACHB-168]|uniref:hypothetical protein n=1 Tax=Calothrix sp. FACHB-168 TaxID=2692780 RepID=UPI001F54C735|nr:hypothetical protein [Calothrix sp. FACHB-168]